MSSALGLSQDYEFIDFFIEDKIPDAQIRKKMEPLLSGVTTKLTEGFLTEDFLREQWEPIKSENIPDIKQFLDGISIDHLSLFVAQQDSSSINLDKLANKVTLVDNVYEHLKKGKSLCQISKPFISCSQDWAIVYLMCLSSSASSGGNWYIYRKVDDKWILYHKMNMLLS